MRSISGRYVLGRLLGRGGMGEVYEARDSLLGRTIALKVLRLVGDTTATARLLREARAAVAFEHPNAVTVFDVGLDEGVAYLAMELVKGRTLRELVGDSSISLERRLRWLVDSARALDAAHRVGLVHRDVKPENLMVRHDDTVKVLDFGIARAHSAPADSGAPTQAPAATDVGTLTVRDGFVGTPAYAAPEHLRGEGLDGRADQFAWGVTAYELCTGRHPFQGDGFTLISSILSQPPLPFSGEGADLPEEVRFALLRTLAKRPEERFTSMAELAEVVEPFASNLRSEKPGRSSTQAPRASETAPPPRRRGRVFAVVGAVLIIVAGAGWIGRRRSSVPAESPPIVSAVRCQPATIDGSDYRDLARALGIGACARLATELGVEWLGGDLAPPLAVRARVRRGNATATLEILGRHADGAGTTPLAAVDAAIARLVGKLSVPPIAGARVRDWGAKDALGARRIERAWQRIMLRLSARPEIDARELVEKEPPLASR